MDLTKLTVKRALGIKSDAQLAKFFGTTKQAVSQWGDENTPIPDARQWQARALRPDRFRGAPKKGAANG